MNACTFCCNYYLKAIVDHVCMIRSGVIVTFGCLYKQTFRKMSLNDSVLPENLLNEEEQALNSLIPENRKTGGTYLKS
jgi:hypothetical protein